MSIELEVEDSLKNRKFLSSKETTVFIFSNCMGMADHTASASNYVKFVNRNAARKCRSCDLRKVVKLQ